MTTPLISFLAAALFALTGAATGVSAQTQSDRAAISPLALVGLWTASAPTRDGKTMTTRVTLTQSQKFFGSATIDDKPVWTFSGRWELRADRGIDVLTWTYGQSVPELPGASSVDRDDVVAIDAARMVLRSHLSGKQNVFTRVN